MENSIIELLTSISVVSGIGIALAFFIELASRYLEDYGERKIIINNDKELVVEGGRPLLSTLKSQNIYIPSACGGKGTCAYCKVRMIEGGGPVLPTETPYLSPEDFDGNVRLSCQVKVKEDLKIEIPEDLFLVKQFRARVVDIRDLTHEIKGIRMDLLSPEGGITFKPGQYVQLEVPRYERIKAPEFRAYSISSNPRERGNLELVITKVPEGAVTTFVHEYLNKDDELTLYGPYGDFYLRESERGILLIATGSGLAPMKSILHQIQDEKIKRETRLFFGAKTPADIYYFDELQELESRLENFKFYPTLSRVSDEDEWDGEKGRVTSLIKKYIPENAAFDVYLCGAPAMIETCMQLLKKKGIPEDHMYFDKFE